MYYFSKNYNIEKIYNENLKKLQESHKVEINKLSTYIKKVQKENYELKQYIDELSTKLRDIKTDYIEKDATIKLLHKTKDLALQETAQAFDKVDKIYKLYEKTKDELTEFKKENEKLKQRLENIASQEKQTQLTEEELRNIVADALSSLLYGEMNLDEE